MKIQLSNRFLDKTPKAQAKQGRNRKKKKNLMNWAL